MKCANSCCTDSAHWTASTALREFSEHTVTGGIDQATAVRIDLGSECIPGCVQGTERRRLVIRHEPRVASDVGSERIAASFRFGLIGSICPRYLRIRGL